MKYCIKCGAQMEDEQRFCVRCGYSDPGERAEQQEPIPPETVSADAVSCDPLPEQVQPMKEKKGKEKKRSRKKMGLIVTAIVLAFVVLAAAVLWLIYYFSPQQRIIRLLNDNKLEKAMEVYDGADMDDAAALEAYIKNRISLLVSEYAGGSRLYPEVMNELETYRAMDLSGDVNKAYESAIVEMGLLKASKENYDFAVKNEEGKNYSAAIQCYLLVSQQDTQNYKTAQQKITVCQDAYREEILDEAKTYANKNLYTDAITKIDEGLGILPDDKVLLDTRNTYTQQVRAKVLDGAKVYASQGNYIDALKALADHRSDTEIDSAYKAYMAEYAAAIKKEAETAMSQSGYTAAMKIIDEALRNFPNAKELTAIRDSYKEFAPVYISSCSIMEDAADGLEKNKYLKDKYENKYSTSFSVDEGSVTFLAANKYKSFTGVIACPYEITAAPSSSARITIYTDNTVAFTSEWFFMTTAPQNFQIDLTGVQTVKIVWEYERGSSWGTSNGGHRATIFDGAFNTY